MPLELFLLEAIVVIATAVVVVVVCSKLQVPALVGLLLTGLVIGPSGLALVAEPEAVEIFAEIGVVLLLFTIGLELSLERLRELRRVFFLGGSLQAGLTGAATAAVARLFGLPLAVSLFLGFLVALSSTAVVLKLYAERQENDTPQGRVVLGILLFQDFLIVPLIVLTPVLAGEAAATPLAVAGRFLAALLVVAVIFGAALWLLPWILHHLVRTRAREVLVLGALGICLGGAYLTHTMGFSLALGAFLAGILVSETEYSHQVIADVGPFRDVFASLFFVSVGMLVDLSFARENWPLLVGLAAGIVLLKSVLVAGVTGLIGYPLRIALIAGLGLAQIGEFSFVLMEVGREHALLDGDRFQLLLSAAVLTLFATPALVRWAPALGAAAARWSGRPSPPPEEGERLEGHVVIVGFGFNGSLLARVMEGAGISYVAVELNAETVRRARREGRRVLYGDATRREVLEHAGVPAARVVVLAISDSIAQWRCVRLVRELNPTAELVVRTRRIREIDHLRALGADDVVAEELEAALEIFTAVLERYHVPRNVIRAQIRALRAEGYEMLRTPAPGEAVSEAVLDALAAGTADLFRVGAGSPAAGRTLKELELRRRSGASVIALVRGERSHPNPSPDLAIEPGDCLVLVGSHQEIDQAFDLLEGRVVR